MRINIHITTKNMKTLKDYIPYAIIIGLILMLLLKDCASNKNQKPYDPQLHFNKIDSTFSKQMQNVHGNLKDLKELNDSLYNIVKKIQGQKTVITETKIIVRTDTLRLPSTIITYNDSTYGSSWKYQRGDFQRLSGVSKFHISKRGDKFIVTSDTTYINDNIYKLKLVTGIRKIKGKEEIFVRSLDPLAQVSELEGYQVERKKKHFVFGPQVGYGIGAGFKPQVFIGAGITYKIFEF